MFNNKKDPLVDSVKTVMAENAKRRDAESRVNEAFGVTSKRGLPHELHADYDAALQKATEVALKEETEEKDEKPFHLKGDKVKKIESPKGPKGEKIPGLRTFEIDPEKSEKKDDLKEGSIRSLAKKIAVNTYKNKKFVAAQNMPGKDADQHAARITKVKELAKEETEQLDELSTDKLAAYQKKLHTKDWFGFGKSPMEKSREKGYKGYWRDHVNRSKGNELAAKKQNPLTSSTGVKVRASNPLEEETQDKQIKESFEHFLRNKFLKD